MKRTLPPAQWRWIALTFCLILAGQYAFYLPDLLSSRWFMIQDDGRHFVAWLRKLADPGLFPDDPIERMFSSLTPALYKLLYFPAIYAGVDVVRWHLLAVMPFSALLFVWSADRFTAVFVDEPAERALVLVCLSAMYFGLYSVGLPRSFGLSIVLLTVSTFAAGQRWQLAIVLALGTNMYPAAAITAGGGIACAEALRLASERRIDPKILTTLAIAAVSGGLGLAVFLAAGSDLGPTITLSEARELPIFQKGGRTSFFSGDTFFRISCKDRSRLLEVCGRGGWWWIGYPLTLLVIGGGLVAIQRRSGGAWRLLCGLCISGIILFSIATVIAFRAHLPSRYSFHSVGLTFHFLLFVMVAAWVCGFLKRRRLPAQALAVVALVVLTAVVLKYAGSRKAMVQDRYPVLSATLRTLPKDTLVAGTVSYVDNIPAFAERSVYAALELAVPYKLNYYKEIESRAAALATLYGSSDSETWRAAHAHSGIDIYVVDSEGVRDLAWAQSFPVAPRAGAMTIFELNRDSTERCTIATERNLSLVDAACFEKALAE